MDDDGSNKDVFGCFLSSGNVSSNPGPPLRTGEADGDERAFGLIAGVNDVERANVFRLSSIPYCCIP